MPEAVLNVLIMNAVTFGLGALAELSVISLCQHSGRAAARGFSSTGFVYVSLFSRCAMFVCPKILKRRTWMLCSYAN